MTDFKYIVDDMNEAIRNGDLERFKYLRSLVEKNSVVFNAYDADFLIGTASWYGYVEIVKFAIEKGANVHHMDDFPLRGASSNGHLEVVKYLLDHNADIHAVNDYSLNSARYHGHSEVVKYLLDHGAK